MPQITSIKQQKKESRFNIYLDDKFGFGIDIDNFVILGLKVGQNLTSEEIETVIRKAEFQKILEKILRFGMIRPRSKKEFIGWLRQKKVPDVIHKDLFSKLKHFKLLDDFEFAKWWIETRQSYSPKTKRILKNELIIKGIDQDIITAILDETEIDELKLARETLLKRRFHWDRFEDNQKEKKMLGYLVGKGFDFEIAKKAIKSYNGTHV